MNYVLNYINEMQIYINKYNIIYIHIYTPIPHLAVFRFVRLRFFSKIRRVLIFTDFHYASLDF